MYTKFLKYLVANTHQITQHWVIIMLGTQPSQHFAFFLSNVWWKVFLLQVITWQAMWHPSTSRNWRTPHEWASETRSPRRRLTLSEPGQTDRLADGCLSDCRDSDCYSNSRRSLCACIILVILHWEVESPGVMIVMVGVYSLPDIFSRRSFHIYLNVRNITKYATKPLWNKAPHKSNVNTPAVTFLSTTTFPKARRNLEIQNG